MSQQNELSAASLMQFARPVTISFVDKAQDWPTRQKIAYEAMLALLKADFHGLKDFSEQMELFSTANPMQLKAPWAAIKALAPLNRNLLLRLVPDPLLGTMVGRFLSTVLGFSRINLQPEEILAGSLGSKLGIG
jgi:hypothetical protein